MENFFAQIKAFFSWIGEKKERVIVSIIIFVFVILPALFLVMALGFFNSSGFSFSNSVVSQGISGMYRSGSMGLVSKNVSYDSAVPPSVSAMPNFYFEEKASTPALPFDKKIIKNGSLSLIVDNTEQAVLKIGETARSFDGFVENSNVYEVGEGVKSGNISVRVPSKNFVNAIEAFKKIAVKVSNESVSSNDVTAQYVDLEAELKNYKAEEVQYREIMSRAVKIEDVLNVSAKLAEVRGRIDRTQAQMNYLSRQVDMSTISISLTGESEVKIFGIVWRPFTVLKQSIRNLFAELANFADWLIGFAFKLPILIIKLAFLILVLWVVVKVFKKLIRFFWR
jgi:hypothetical protein